MIESKFFKEVNSFVFDILKNKLSSKVVYHNYNHTLQVVKAANEIALAEKVKKSDLEIVLIAAWFHDTGYVEGYKNHEGESKKIAQDYLKNKGFSSEKIAKVSVLIDATKMPQKPTNKIEEIICDADLCHLGTEDYTKNADLLRSEWEQLCNKELTDIEWLKENNRFFGEHKYFTNYAFTKLNSQKTVNWLKVQKDLRKLSIKNKEQELKNKLKKDDLKRKKKKEERPDRGIETMYRVTLRNHMKLSDIADTKANILLSVGAITLSIALSMLFPKLDKPDNYYLIYPTIIFLLTTVVTIIFSIMATRPKVTSGKFTQEDIDAKKVNILFFGNFYKMSLEAFQKGMTEIMNDRDYLYETLMKDLYFLGIVLEKKYRLLRIAYTIFMVGIIISVIAFIVAFEIMRNAEI